MSLKDEIITNMPDGLSELLKARYLYIELGRRVSFSTRYQNTDISSQAEIYSSSVDVEIFNGKQVICRQWSQLYSQLLNQCGIKNRIIDLGHSWVEFEVAGQRWKADATYGSYTDLSRIHNGDETVNFGPLFYQGSETKPEHNFIRWDSQVKNDIKAIDEKLGYNTSKKIKLKELKKLLTDLKNGTFKIRDVVGREELETQDELVLKLEYLFSKLGTLDSGYYEARDFVYEMEKLMLSSEEMNRVKAVELKRTNSQKEVDIIQCIYVETDKGIQHYLLAPNLPIRRTNQDEIINLSLLGYGIGEKGIPGVIYPKKFRVGKISRRARYLLIRNFVPAYLRKYDIMGSR